MRFVKCRSIETTNRTLLGVLFQEENGNDVVASLCFVQNASGVVCVLLGDYVITGK